MISKEFLVVKMKKKKYLQDKELFYIAMAFFVFMMLFNLTHSSLWGDEWVEYTVSQKSIKNGELYRAIMGTFQPPLYNLLLHFWLKINKTILWFRLFNVFCGIMAGVFIYRSAWRLTDPRLASGVLCMLGATYHWVFCIQECSEYSLMLMFLCISIYYYIEAETSDKISSEILFILACVGAMYSQYGAFFVVFLLLIAYFVQGCLVEKKRKIWKMIGVYSFYFVVFALPLYIFFARKQIEYNEISRYSKIFISLKSIKGLLVTFGRLMGYFLNIDNNEISGFILPLIGMLTIAAGSTLLVKKKISSLKKNLIIVLFSAYILHYWLVVFRIYAMVHPDQSYGFYARYSYFYMPVFYVVIPMIWYETVCAIKKLALKIWTIRVIMCSIATSVLMSYPRLLNNWNKAYDQEFAKIWVYNGGFNEITYLIGVAEYGFKYYTALYDCEVKGEVLLSDSIDIRNLPDSFWLWRTNWGGGIWQEIVDKATELGYEVIIYADHGESGQLAYCSKVMEKRR